MGVWREPPPPAEGTAAQAENGIGFVALETAENPCDSGGYRNGVSPKLKRISAFYRY